MRGLRTRKLLASLSALSLAAFTTACAGNANLDRPDISRVTPPAPTKIPRGSVPCTQSSTGWCLSDDENGKLLRDFDKGERTRDSMICWLRDYFGYPPCDG